MGVWEKRCVSVCEWVCGGWLGGGGGLREIYDKLTYA